jgi:hypothetical protein
MWIVELQMQAAQIFKASRRTHFSDFQAAQRNAAIRRIVV